MAVYKNMFCKTIRGKLIVDREARLWHDDDDDDDDELFLWYGWPTKGV